MLFVYSGYMIQLSTAVRISKMTDNVIIDVQKLTTKYVEWKSISMYKQGSLGDIRDDIWNLEFGIVKPPEIEDSQYRGWLITRAAGSLDSNNTIEVIVRLKREYYFVPPYIVTSLLI